MTSARLGDNTTVVAPSASLQVAAISQNNLSSQVYQQTIGGIESNTGKATATANGLQTLAEIGGNNTITVGKFLLSADDANLQSSANAQTECDAGGADDSAFGESDETSNAKGHIAGGTKINAGNSINVVAKNDNISTNAYTKTTVVAGVAHYDSEATSNESETTEADLDPGTQLTAALVSVSATQPAANTYIKNADKTNVSSNPDIDCTRETHGSQNFTNTVNLNSAIYLTDAIDHNLSIDPTGNVTALNGLNATDGTNPLVIGQTISTGQIVISGLNSGNTSTLVVSAPSGTTSGASQITYQTNGAVVIQNASTNSITLGAINVVESGAAPPVSVTANQKNWTYTSTGIAGGGLVNVVSSNPAGGNITLSGAINNPTGPTFIIATGSVLAAGSADSITSSTVYLEADNGTVGTSGQPVPLSIMLGSGAGLVGARGSQGVNLDISPVDPSPGPFTIPISNIVAGSGDVNLKIENGLAGNAPPPIRSPWATSPRRPAISTSLPDRMRSVPSDVSLTGQIASPVGTTTITTTAGNIVSGAADQLIRATRSLSAPAWARLAWRRISASTSIPIISMPRRMAIFTSPISAACSSSAMSLHRPAVFISLRAPQAAGRTIWILMAHRQSALPARYLFRPRMPFTRPRAARSARQVPSPSVAITTTPTLASARTCSFMAQCKRTQPSCMAAPATTISLSSPRPTLRRRPSTAIRPTTVST